jgi:hypothetical protein
MTIRTKLILIGTGVVLCGALALSLYCGGRRAAQVEETTKQTEATKETAHETAKEKRNETQRIVRSGNADRMWKHLLERASRRP